MIVFDRDGTLIGKLGDYEANHPKNIKSVKDIKLIPEVREKLIRLNSPICIASNQGGVHGTIQYKSLEDCKKEFEYLVEICPVPVIWALFCTDNDGKKCYGYYKGLWNDIHKSFPPSIPTVGSFRKSNPGMLTFLRYWFQKLQPELGDIEYYVGDLDSDRECAKNACVDYFDVNDWIKVQEI